MRSDEIRDALKKQPFEPFALRFGSGARVPVVHPEMAIVFPSGNRAVVVIPSTHSVDDKDHYQVVDTGKVESLEFGDPPKWRNGAA